MKAKRIAVTILSGVIISFITTEWREFMIYILGFALGAILEFFRQEEEYVKPQNPALTLKDLKPDMWVWDNELKVYYQIGKDEYDRNWEHYWFDDGLFDVQYASSLDYEPNRFYAREIGGPT